MGASAANVVVLDRARCGGCGLCALSCPQLVFRHMGREQAVALANPERCVGCMACEEDCPESALRVLRLPAGLSVTEVPQPAAGLDSERFFDLVVVGAGPAGLGAAIRARQLGLSVLVLERLPSHRRAHHPDGGLLFAAPDIFQLEESEAGLRLVELDFLIPQSMIRERLTDFALMGPRGRTTRATRRAWAGFPVVTKDEIVARLAERALEDGATLAYNTRVARIQPSVGDLPPSVELADGGVIRGKVVISAEGCTGRLSAKAGIPVNQESVGWSYAVTGELDHSPRPGSEFGFVVGPLEGERDDVSYLGFWSNGPAATHAAVGTLQKKKVRELDEPLTEVLGRTVRRDARLRQHLGLSLDTPAVGRVDGCRVFARRLPRRAVGDGVIAVGDAIATCGMATTLVALRTGAMAAETAAAALAQGRVDRAVLRPFEEQVFQLSMIGGMKWMHNLLIEAPMELDDRGLEQLFVMLERLRLTDLMSGRGAGMVMAGFFARNALQLWRNPRLRRFLMP